MKELISLDFIKENEFVLIEEKDIKTIAKMAGKAFGICDYPFACYIFEGTKRKIEMSELFMNIRYKSVLKQGFIFANNTLQSCMSVKMLRDENTLPYVSTLLKLLGKLKLKEIVAVVQASDFIEKYEKIAFEKLKEDTLFIDVLAVDVDCQKNGYAKKMLEALLGQIKKENRAVALYTNTAYNEKYYQKFGFETVYTVTDDRFKITTYYMVKKP